MQLSATAELSGIEAEAGAARPARRVRRGLRIVGFLGLAVALFVGGVGVDRATEPPRPSDPTEFALITQAWELLHDEYVDAAHLDPAALAYGAIDGMADAVGDTGHTFLFTPEEVVAADAELSGSSYGGIGIELDDQLAVPTISALAPGASAVRAGLEVGDRITAVDGTATDGPDQARVIDTILGAPGTVVVLTIDRPGGPTHLEVSVTRALVERTSVDWSMVPGTKAALIRLSVFSVGSARELRAAIGRALRDGATGIILDLRGNPGGLSREAVHVASVFLPHGVVVVRNRDAHGNEYEDAVPSDAVTVDLPLVVLVDGDSASSSEILAAALQDAHRATIVGTTTQGTGTMMDTFPLADGSELWIGTTEWRTPAGRSVWHVGLEPDVSVSLATGVVPVTPARLPGLGVEGLAKSGDAQLLQAISQFTRG